MSHKAISIAMVTGAYFPEISGGGLQCRTLVNSAKRDFDFVIITTSKDRSLSGRDFVEGMPVYRIYVDLNNIFYKIKGLLSIFYTFNLSNLKKKIQIIHLHGFSNKSIIIILLAKIFKKKIIQKLTSVGYDDPLCIRKRLGSLRFRIYSLADVYVTVSPAISSEFKKSSIAYKRLVEIPNGVDVGRFGPCPNKEVKTSLKESILPAALNKKLILTVGFFSYDKAPDCTYEAFKRIVRRFEDLILLFIGSTDVSYYEVSRALIEYIKNDIERSTLSGRVIFIENTLRIEDYYKISDFFIMPSVREGMPNVLLEAMASGLPCIATRIPGVTDVIIEGGDNGILIEPRDINAISENLVRLLEDASFATRLSQRARETIVEKYSIDDIAHRYSRLYKELSGCVG